MIVCCWNQSKFFVWWHTDSIAKYDCYWSWARLPTNTLVCQRWLSARVLIETYTYWLLFFCGNFHHELSKKMNATNLKKPNFLRASTKLWFDKNESSHFNMASKLLLLRKKEVLNDWDNGKPFTCVLFLAFFLGLSNARFFRSFSFDFMWITICSLMTCTHR